MKQCFRTSKKHGSIPTIKPFSPVFHRIFQKKKKNGLRRKQAELNNSKKITLQVKKLQGVKIK